MVTKVTKIHVLGSTGEILIHEEIDVEWAAIAHRLLMRKVKELDEAGIQLHGSLALRSPHPRRPGVGGLRVDQWATAAMEQGRSRVGRDADGEMQISQDYVWDVTHELRVQVSGHCPLAIAAALKAEGLL